MKLYHVSTNPDLKVMIPRIPNNAFTLSGIEDNVHKRICFAPSIQQALRAYARPINKETLYVYTPIGLNNRWIYKPKPTQVPDAGMTKEIWYLRPCKVKLVEVIVGGKRLGKQWTNIDASKLSDKVKKRYVELEYPNEINNWRNLTSISLPSYSNIKYKSIRKTGQLETEYDPKAGRITLFVSRIVNRDDMPIFNCDAESIDKSKIQLQVRAKEPMFFSTDSKEKYGDLFLYNIVYDGQVIGCIEKEQYMDGTSLAEGFYINPKFRNKGIGSAVLQMKEFRGAFIAPGNTRVRILYKRLSQSTWKNFSEKEKDQWRNMYKKYRGMYKLK